MKIAFVSFCIKYCLEIWLFFRLYFIPPKPNIICITGNEQFRTKLILIFVGYYIILQETICYRSKFKHNGCNFDNSLNLISYADPNNGTQTWNSQAN